METRTLSTAIKDMKHDGLIQFPKGSMIFGPSHLIPLVSHGLSMNKPLAKIVDRVTNTQQDWRGSRVAHELFRTGDEDAPSVIRDRNAEVVLDLCRYCGKGESQLLEGGCMSFAAEGGAV